MASQVLPPCHPEAAGKQTLIVRRSWRNSSFYSPEGNLCESGCIPTIVCVCVCVCVCVSVCLFVVLCFQDSRDIVFPLTVQVRTSPNSTVVTVTSQEERLVQATACPDSCASA